jgi:hypothetical protein
MTVSSETSRKTFTGDASTTSFDTNPVVFFDEEDLTVYVVTTATGEVVDTLVLNTDYSVTGGDGAVGTVSLAGGSSPYGAHTSAQTLVIVRDLEIVQESDFVQNDGSDAEVAEDALDRLTMIAQQLAVQIARSVRLADSDVSGASVTLPTPAANAIPAWNAAGTALENKFGTDIDLALATAYILTLIDDTTSLAARSTLRDGDWVSPLDYSGVGDGVADDSTPLANAIASGKTVRIPKGYTFLTTGQTVSTVGQVVEIRGKVKLKNSTDQSVFTVSASGVKILGAGGGEIDGNKANQTTSTDSLGSCVWLADGVDNVEVRDLYIHDAKRNGVAGFGNHDGCVVFGNRIVDCGFMGVYPAQTSARACKRWLISANEISGFGQDGVGTVAIQHSVISGNRFVHPSDGVAVTCVALEASCDYTAVFGNTFVGTVTVDGSGSGVQVNDTTCVSVTGNVFKSLGIAISFHGAAAGSFNVSATGNVIDDCGYAGQAIRLAPTTGNHDMRAIVNSNVINNSPLSAIHVAGASHCDISHNQIYGVNLQNTASKRFVSGICLLAQAYFNTIIGNTIIEGTSGNLKIGIHEQGSAVGENSGNNTIKDNRISGADYDIICGGTAYGLTSFSKVTRVSDAAVSAAPTTGHWERGDAVPNEQPASGGAPGWACTTGGTFGAQTATNASITNGQTTLTFANAADAAKFHSGMKIQISNAGPASGVLDTYVQVFDGTGLACTVLNAASTTTTTAGVSCVNPVFKAEANLA